MNNKGVKAQEDDLEEENCVVAEHFENHIIFHEKSNAEEAEACEEETDEEHKPPADRSEEPCHQEAGDKVDPTDEHPPVIGVGI